MRLALERFPARGKRVAVCLCTHAMMASGRYLSTSSGDASNEGRGFAGYLAAAGLDTFVLDWRGHGQSRAASARALRSWCFDDYVTYDLPAAVDAVCTAAGIAPGELVYVGHSLGGLVGLAAMGQNGDGGFRPRALALFATAVWLPGPRGARARRLIMSIYDLMSRPLGHAPIRRLGLGSEDEPRGYVEQLTTWARTGAWRSREGVDYLAGLGRIEVPVWAACGLADRLCTRRDAEVIVSRLRGARPLRLVGKAAGDALDADHFTLFTRRALAPVWDELIDFIAHTD